MKTIWNVEVRTMDGTVTIATDTVAFNSNEAAENVAKNIKKLNEGSDFPVLVRVYESKLYTSEEEYFDQD